MLSSPPARRGRAGSTGPPLCRDRHDRPVHAAARPEIADCNERIALEFDIGNVEARENSLHKLDTLVSALRLFRAALVDEFEPYDRRQRELEALRQ